MPGENKSMHLSLQHSSLHLCSPLAGIQGQWLERVTGMCFCLLFRAPCCWNWWVFFHSLKRTFYWLYILKMWSEPKSSWECGEKKEWGNLRPPKCKMIENGIWGWGVADNSGRVSMLGAPCTHRKLMAVLWDTSPGQGGTSQGPLSALGWSRTCTVTLQGLCIAGVGRSTASCTGRWLQERWYPSRHPTTHLWWFTCILFCRETSWGAWWVSFSFLSKRLPGKRLSFSHLSVAFMA